MKNPVEKQLSARIKTKFIVSRKEDLRHNSLYLFGLQNFLLFYNKARLKRTKTTGKNSRPMVTFL